MNLQSKTEGDLAPATSVIESIIAMLYDELEKRGDSEMTEFMRGQLHGAKWMLQTLRGRSAKDCVLHAVRAKLRKPIPHVVMKMADGYRYGFDSDAG